MKNTQYCTITYRQTLISNPRVTGLKNLKEHTE